MTQQAYPEVFASYARPDRDRIEPICDWLEAEGFTVWVDFRRLLPGQDWDFAIRRALDRASLVVVFISRNSFERRGFQQREIKLALDKRREKLVEDIYLIPVLLDDDVEIPEELKEIQAVTASEDRFREGLVESLRYQFGRLGLELARTQRETGVSWSTRRMKESWEGLPGYEAELEFLELQSDRYPGVREIGDYLKGELIEGLFRERHVKLLQSAHFNYGQPVWERTNTYGARCRGVAIKGRVLTVHYLYSWYGAGAAHPNYGSKTYPFVLEPFVLIPSLESVFLDPEAALVTLQRSAREQLLSIRLEGGIPASLDANWLEEGTAAWVHFSAFVFNPDELQVLFSPYQVAPYAYGTLTTTHRYDELSSLLRPEYRSALEIPRGL